MAIAKIGSMGSFDLSEAAQPWEERCEKGKALRKIVSRESHAKWTPHKKRSDPVDIIVASNQGRQANLIPLRMGRMAASPFAFLRGSACVMAADLATTPITGVPVVMDGDAHLSNFGMYGTPQREVVFDLNDFDEAVVGPWEWDLKRLAASVNVAARANGMNRRERAVGVKSCVEGYRLNARRLRNMGVLEIWYLHAYPGRANPLIKASEKARAVFRKTFVKAMQTENRTLLPKVADKGKDGHWKFRNDPPVLTRVDTSTRAKVIEALNKYSLTLLRERRLMLSRYHVADVAHRVVGVGSVGTRAYLVLLFGNGDGDPLFLQVKEAVAPVHEAFLPPRPQEFSHNGKRVVYGQRTLQASSDPLLGYTEIDGRDFYVRQMKNLKASIPIEWLTGSAFDFYAWVCGAILARAHARTGDPARISGYCGNSRALDEALAEWAESYGDQNDRDHAALLAAIGSGKVKADIQADDGS
jgi:uncharacterized protein (DUF2252 family)